MMKNNFLLSLIFLYSNVIVLIFGACVVSDLDTARSNGLDRHNYYRAKHGVPNLVLDTTLNNVAQSYSDYLASNNLFSHSSNGYGENLYKGCSSAPITDIKNEAVSATNSWYSEIQKYNFSNPGFSSGTGHFTQVVWKNSASLGLGISKGMSGSWYCVYVVGNYNPPGNYLGQFAQNVLPPTS